MSTRASIKLIQKDYPDIYIYHHSDGGMWFVGRDLIDRIKNGLEKQQYLWCEDFANELVKDSSCDYEITHCIHGDEEYFYELDFDKHTLHITAYDDEISAVWDNAEELENARKWKGGK